jgi:hypothetical protein
MLGPSTLEVIKHTSALRKYWKPNAKTAMPSQIPNLAPTGIAVYEGKQPSSPATKPLTELSSESENRSL